MLTVDLIAKLLNEDEGRWRVANHGQPIDEYYLRKELKGYVPPLDKGLEATAPLRRWRPSGSTAKKWGYHELHFVEAFSRYLGKRLPSKEPPEDDEDTPSKHPPSRPPKTSGPSRPSGPRADSTDISMASSGPDAGLDAEAGEGPIRTSIPTRGWVGPGPDGGGVSGPASGPGQVFELSEQLAVGPDGLDGLDISGGIKKENERASQFPRAPVGRKVQKPRPGSSADTTDSPDTTAEGE
jgi:hypothetical protein